MQWSDVTALRPGRCFVNLPACGLSSSAAWRRGARGRGRRTVGVALAIGALVVGGIGLVRPMAIRFIFTGWMIAAFPIGWTISRVVLAATFYALFTPVAFIFRLMGRDALRLHRGDPQSHWLAQSRPGTPDVFQAVLDRRHDGKF